MLVSALTCTSHLGLEDEDLEDAQWEENKSVWSQREKAQLPSLRGGLHSFLSVMKSRVLDP